jgi:putative endonuclease
VGNSYFVYLLASDRYGTLYVGVTSDLVKRVWEHKEGVVSGFTRTYNVKRLVWYEVHEDINAAMLREKQIKKWNRRWKIELIQSRNPLWEDLYDTIIGRTNGSRLSRERRPLLSSSRKRGPMRR